MERAVQAWRAVELAGERVRVRAEDAGGGDGVAWYPFASADRATVLLSPPSRLKFWRQTIAVYSTPARSFTGAMAHHFLASDGVTAQQSRRSILLDDTLDRNTGRLL
jgi:hypothetical protein